SAAANLPDPLVRFPPRLTRGVGDPPQSAPQSGIKLSTALDPLVRAIEDLAINIMLALVGSPVAPPNWPRPAISLDLTVLPFFGNRIAVKGVHDPRRPTPLERVEDPAKEAVGLVDETDAAHGEDSERRIANPRVAIIPVANPTDWRRQGRRRRGDERPAGP